VLIEKKRLLNEFAGDEEILIELRRVFLAELPKMLAAIEMAIRHGNAPAIESSSHALKGAVSNFQTPVVRDAVYALELTGRDGKVEVAAAQFNELTKLLLELSKELGTII
jgi:HPt (histidine-containing phosphotransfer) domain-containing protein